MKRRRTRYRTALGASKRCVCDFWWDGPKRQPNDAAHAYIGAIMAECGAEYHAGPVKIANRIQAKADADYGGDVTKVIETVRAAARAEFLAKKIRGKRRVQGTQ